MQFVVELDVGRKVCVESIHGFLRAVDDLNENGLLGASRCPGWTRMDALVHVLAGWQEMLAGLVSLVDTAPTVDAASYWQAFAAQYGDEDPVLQVMSQRRRTSVYPRPASARSELHDVADAVLLGVQGLGARPCTWQGHVFAPGDYLAVWAVEVVVHHLDLFAKEPVPPDALRLTRDVIEALVEAPLPADWSDEDAVLIGTGRIPMPTEPAWLASRLPALG
jgi:uncharacterized protein (TIGR03083 family)